MTIFVGFVTFVSFSALVAVFEQIRSGAKLDKGTHLEMWYRLLVFTWGAVLLALEFFGG